MEIKITIPGFIEFFQPTEMQYMKLDVLCGGKRSDYPHNFGNDFIISGDKFNMLKTIDTTHTLIAVHLFTFLQQR